jgi:hypothetical protein
MIPTMPVLPLTASVLNAIKKKRVLLIDSSSRKRELRAEIMRKLGIEVDCAADLDEARSWWKADLYNLVLFSEDNSGCDWNDFCGDIRGATPPQQLAFLVGHPEYLSDSPRTDGEWSTEMVSPKLPSDTAKVARASDIVHTPERWGILEASRKISAVRSASVARSRAMQDRPVPPRDFEGQRSRRTSRATTLDDLLREELQ